MTTPTKSSPNPAAPKAQRAPAFPSARTQIPAAMTGPDSRGNEPPSSRWALVSLALVVVLPSLNTSIANVALPHLTEAFSASFQSVQWVVLSYLLAITTLVVSAGRLGDMIGRRRLLITGVGLFTIASAVCGTASTLPVLVAGRAAQGLGAAIMMALTLAFVGETVPGEKKGRAMGLLGTMSAVGTALGPSLGGLLISRFGWHAVFLVNLPLGILALLLVTHHLPADRKKPNTEPAKFDAVGTLVLALALAAYALAMTIGRGQLGVVNAALLIAAATAAGLFVRVEATAAYPLIRLSMFQDRTRRTGIVTSALVATVIMTTLVVGPFYLSRSLGLDAARVGLVLSVGPLVAALCGVPAGRYVDRFGTRWMTVAGLAGMAMGAVALCLIPATWGIGGYVLPLIVITAGYAFFQTANNTAVMAGVDADERGVISGLLNLSRNLGLITGASLMGAIFAFAASATDIATASPGAVATGMRATFGISAALVVVALIIMALHRPARSSEGAP